MNHLRIKFRTGNAAFRDENNNLIHYEVSEIVRGIAEKIGGGSDYGVVVDYNGNTVGQWSLREEDND